MKPVWALGMAIVGLFMGLGWYLQPLQPSIVALQFTFSPGAFQAVLDAWGPQGMQRFRTHLGFDGALLLCYGAFGYLLVVRGPWFGGFSTLARRHVAILMPLAALFDAVENLLHGHLTSETLVTASVVYGAAGGAASAKWLCLLLFALLCAVAAWRRHRG